MAYTFCGDWESDSILSGSHTGKSVLALQVKKRKSVWRRSIYRKYVYWNRLQKRGTKFKWGRSFKHWSRGSLGQCFTETEYLRASAIFVSGTSGIPPNLNYRSVSPIIVIGFYFTIFLWKHFDWKLKILFSSHCSYPLWALKSTLFLCIPNDFSCYRYSLTFYSFLRNKKKENRFKVFNIVPTFRLWGIYRSFTVSSVDNVTLVTLHMLQWEFWFKMTDDFKFEIWLFYWSSKVKKNPSQ